MFHSGFSHLQIYLYCTFDFFFIFSEKYFGSVTLRAAAFERVFPLVSAYSYLSHEQFKKNKSNSHLEHFRLKFDLSYLICYKFVADQEIKFIKKIQKQLAENDSNKINFTKKIFSAPNFCNKKSKNDKIIRQTSNTIFFIADYFKNKRDQSQLMFVSVFDFELIHRVFRTQMNDISQGF